MNEDEARNERLKQAARELGFKVPDDATIHGTSMISFGLGPEGIEGGEALSAMLHSAWMNARLRGAPVEALEHMAATLLGGFALAIAHSLVGEDGDNPMELAISLMSESNEERSMRAADLCDHGAMHLREFAPFADERTAEEGFEPLEPLVDPEAAAELARLFETAAAEKEKRDEES